jgi:hypothetical protein
MEGKLCKKCHRWRPIDYCPYCDCASRTYTTPDNFDRKAVKINNHRETISKPYIKHVYKLTPSKIWVDKELKFYWNQNKVYFNFGKHKNKSLNDVANDSPGYLQWITGEDFSPFIKKMALDALQGIFPSQTK